MIIIVKMFVRVVMANNYICCQLLNSVATHDKLADAFSNCISVFYTKLHTLPIKVISLPFSRFQPECFHSCKAAKKLFCIRF